MTSAGGKRVRFLAALPLRAWQHICYLFITCLFPAANFPSCQVAEVICILGHLSHVINPVQNQISDEILILISFQFYGCMACTHHVVQLIFAYE